MGHLTLIAEEVLKLAERIPLELLDPLVVQKLTSPEWNEYVDVTLTETRTRDNAILGGVRPQPSGLGGGINSSVLGTATSELSGGDDGAVLAAIVNRGIRYENGDAAHGEDEFEDDQEDREASEEPVSVPTFVRTHGRLIIASLFGTCHKVLQTIFQTNLVVQMRMMTMKKWLVGWAKLENLKPKITTTTTTKPMKKMKTTMCEGSDGGDYFMIDGKGDFKTTMMSLVFEDSEPALPHKCMTSTYAQFF